MDISVYCRGRLFVVLAQGSPIYMETAQIFYISYIFESNISELMRYCICKCCVPSRRNSLCATPTSMFARHTVRPPEWPKINHAMRSEFWPMVVVCSDWANPGWETGKFWPKDAWILTVFFLHEQHLGLGFPGGVGKWPQPTNRRGKSRKPQKNLWKGTQNPMAHLKKKWNKTRRKNMNIRTALNVKELGFDSEMFGCPKCGDVPTLFVHDIWRMMEKWVYSFIPVVP